MHCGFSICIPPPHTHTYVDSPPLLLTRITPLARMHIRTGPTGGGGASDLEVFLGVIRARFDIRIGGVNTTDTALHVAA
jgi:hypothetical protein